MKQFYRNKWIPKDVFNILAKEQGTILDVGGGAAPYIGATHIIDCLPFSNERLKANSWETASDEQKKEKEWMRSQYTQIDLCEESKWPFEDNYFDLGISSHCLEDLREPLHAVRELSRTCKRVLIITPSRLLEQTRNIDHPRYCGFHHHPWIVFEEDRKIIFRRKTAFLELPRSHIVCPLGKTLKVEYGASFFYGNGFTPEERVFWEDNDDYNDYMKFIEPFRGRSDIFMSNRRPRDLKFYYRYLRQNILGEL